MNATAERITTILVEDLRVPREAMGPETTFGELGLDSLVLVELSLVLDTEFGIELGDGELVDHMTVAQAAAVVDAKHVVVS